MKKRVLTSMLLTIVLSAFGVAAAMSKADESRAGKGAAGAAGPVQPAPPPPQQGGPDASTVDGSKTPELIPDHVAYSLLFRFLSERKSADEKERGRAYLKAMFGCSHCGDHKERPESLSNDQMEALLAAAQEFGRQVSELDKRALRIRYQIPPEQGDVDLSGLRGQQPPLPDAAAKAELARLQKEKEALTVRMAASLPARLGKDGAGKVQQFVRDVFKRKIKYRPKPDNSSAAGNPA